MLKMSTKGRYGLRAMIDLASAHSQNRNTVTMGEIAERQNLSHKYLHALLISLKHAGLIRAIHGAKGGYSLTREPEMIKLSEILEALEGNLCMVDCVNEKANCPKQPNCAAHPFWKELNQSIFKLLDGVTLIDLMCNNINFSLSKD